MQPRDPGGSTTSLEANRRARAGMPIEDVITQLTGIQAD